MICVPGGMNYEEPVLHIVPMVKTLDYRTAAHLCGRTVEAKDRD